MGVNDLCIRVENEGDLITAFGKMKERGILLEPSDIVRIVQEEV